MDRIAQNRLSGGMMRNFGLRYASLLGIVMTLFITFVACGSQLYKASLHGDTTETAGATMANQDGPTDPNSKNYGLHAPSGWSDRLPLHWRTDYRMPQDQVKGLMKAMSTWETAVGRKLFAYDGLHEKVGGDTFPDLYSSLGDMINGLYLDNNWTKTGKPEVVLATTIWDNDPSNASKIITGDMRFNNQYYVFGDSLVIKADGSREVVDIQTLATHELGHLLGLAHIQPSVDPNSIMVPSLYIGEGLTDRRISLGDLQRIQKIYGCQGTACNSDETLKTIGQNVAEAGDNSSGSGSAGH